MIRRTDIKEIIKKYVEEISTPEVKISIDKREYDNCRISKTVLTANLTFAAPYAKNSSMLGKDTCLKNVLEKLPDGYDARLIENKGKEYPDEAVIGEIYTTKDIGPVPKDTVVCIFTSYGNIRFFEHCRFFVVYEEEVCTFKPDTYEGLLVKHAETFVRKLFKCSETGKSVESALAKSYIYNTAKYKVKEETKIGPKTVYYNERNEVFAEKLAKNGYDNYRMLFLPSLPEVAEFIREIRTMGAGLSLLEGYLMAHYENPKKENSLIRLKCFPDDIAFSFDAIYQNEEVLVDCKKTFPEIVDEIFKVCKSYNIKTVETDAVALKNPIYIDSYKYLIALYTNLSKNTKHAVFGKNASEYKEQYDRAFNDSEAERRKFFGTEFLKQAILYIFINKYTLSPFQEKKDTKIAVIDDLVANCEIKMLAYDEKMFTLDIRLTINEDDYIVGYLAKKTYAERYELVIYPEIVEKLADVLYSELSLEELSEAYFSPKVLFNKFYKRAIMWEVGEVYLGKTINSVPVSSKVLKNKDDIIEIIDVGEAIVTRKLSPEEELEILGNMKLFFGKAKNYAGMTIAEAFAHPDLHDWFMYICEEKDMYGNVLKYVGSYPSKMRRYNNIKKLLEENN